MRALWAWVAICVGLLSACLSTRLVNLDHVDASWPVSSPQRGWRADVAELLSRYERLRVLAPQDDRLDPLFGGLTTLSYFRAASRARSENPRGGRGDGTHTAGRLRRA
jgi:hypothetical protein